jgi:hypothetical protein
MKTLITSFVLFASFSTYACQCQYDWMDKDHLARAAVLLEVPANTINVSDYNIYNTPRALIDRETYQGCGCTRFVRQVYDIHYKTAELQCSAKVVYSRNLDKIKVKKINCL